MGKEEEEEEEEECKKVPISSLLPTATAVRKKRIFISVSSYSITSPSSPPIKMERRGAHFFRGRAVVHGHTHTDQRFG